MKIGLDSTSDFKSWLEELPLKEELQIRKRLYAVEQEGHFGDCKYLDDGLFELRWKNGKRVYFAKLSDKRIILLLGGRKNAQEKEIKKARILLKGLSFSRPKKGD
ncbi:MAG TPA: type II toxin-antitoxin system RelE/ParE family toxin [Chlamydiales bacterium]|nr:type II toxin-antitoxin system RelE/ParE family toxin [Chlamydiales bacterium]